MAILSPCPHCQVLLQLPEGCEGLTARCPSCLAGFVIAGAEPRASAALVCAVMTPVAGRVTHEELERARLHLAELTAEHVNTRLELARQDRRRRQQSRRLRVFEFCQSSRDTLDHSCGRWGGFFIAIAAVPAVLVLLASALNLSAFGYLFVIVFGLILATGGYTLVAFYPEDDELDRLIPGAIEKLGELSIRCQRLIGDEAEQHVRIVAAEEEHQRISDALASRLHWLRTCQWPEMTGRGFANFVALSLEEHGYHVQQVRAGSPQGADLVAGRDGKLVAVHTQGDAQRAADVDAVVEAQNLMRAANCQSAVVVTNSRFSAGARELAARTACKLIDGAQIIDLIEGRIIL